MKAIVCVHQAGSAQCARNVSIASPSTLPEPYLYEPLDTRQDVAGELPPYDASHAITGDGGRD